MVVGAVLERGAVNASDQADLITSCDGRTSHSVFAPSSGVRFEEWRWQSFRICVGTAPAFVRRGYR